MLASNRMESQYFSGTGKAVEPEIFVKREFLLKKPVVDSAAIA